MGGRPIDDQGVRSGGSVRLEGGRGPAPHGGIPGRRRVAALVIVLALVAGVAGWAAADGAFDGGTASTAGPGSGSAGAIGSGEVGLGSTPEPTPSPTPRPPIGGTELYGYVPYWEMSQTMVGYLASVPVSTLALFSVSATTTGAVKTTDTGYRRITGSIGRQLIAGAHDRRQHVDLVFTSFGQAANARLFGPDPKARARHITAAAQLAALAIRLGVDGVNLDVEQIDPADTPGYGAFIQDLRFDLRTDAAKGRPAFSISVATTSDHDGAIAALAAVQAGVDRVFLMGYGYHWSGSSPGAVAPIQSRDTAHDLTTSIVDYVETGVPRDRILLGLPLYGMSWPVASADPNAVAVGKGTTYIPSTHAAQLLKTGFAPLSDDQETAEWFVTRKGTGFVATYYDSPRTLLPKLELARSQGLAGAGFWALGYERGLPGYLQLMADWRAGRIGG